MRLFMIAASLVAANFLYQAFGAHNWHLALDRSWFQFSAVYITGLSLWLADRATVGGEK